MPPSAITSPHSYTKGCEARTHPPVAWPRILDVVSSDPRAVLVPVADRPEADLAVLVLHGGSSDSFEPVARTSLAAARLIPVAWAIAHGPERPAVYRLRNSVRGWNGDGRAVLDDARTAIETISRTSTRRPDRPIVLVGHSLGGRVAFRLAGPAGATAVIGAVGLAPWAVEQDPVDHLDGVPLAVVQGTADRTIPEPTTRPWLARAAAAGAELDETVIDGGDHTMLRGWRRWHAATTAGVSWVRHAAARTR